MGWQQAPLALDPYSRMMAAAFDESAFIGVPTGFQSLFGRPGFGQTLYSPVASVIDIDIIRGNKKTAALIPRGMISRPLGANQRDTSAGKYSSFSRRFPLALEEGAIGADQLEFRGAGENPYAAPFDHLSRVRRLALRNHQAQVRRMILLFERLAAQAIVEGKQDAILDTTSTDEQYDFLRKATHTFSASASWGTAATDIAGDIDDGCELIREDANVNPDFMLCSEEAIKGILKNTALLAWADNRRIGLLQVGSLNAPPMPPAFQRMVDGGMMHRGMIETPHGFRLHVFSYVDTYTDNSGTATKYMPANYAVIGSSQAICDRYFGPPERLPLSPAEEADMRYFMGVDPRGGMMPPNIKGAADVVSPAMFYFDFYKSGRKVFTVETQSAPIFAPTMTDAWVTIDVT
jgi:hypothetical protein